MDLQRYRLEGLQEPVRLAMGGHIEGSMQPIIFIMMGIMSVAFAGVMWSMAGPMIGVVGLVVLLASDLFAYRMIQRNTAHGPLRSVLTLDPQRGLVFGKPLSATIPWANVGPSWVRQNADGGELFLLGLNMQECLPEPVAGGKIPQELDGILFPLPPESREDAVKTAMAPVQALKPFRGDDGVMDKVGLEQAARRAPYPMVIAIPEVAEMATETLMEILNRETLRRRGGGSDLPLFPPSGGDDEAAEKEPSWLDDLDKPSDADKAAPVSAPEPAAPERPKPPVRPNKPPTVT
ncbi:hypothetical protein MAIT1_03862 [Magnetofaba australis IT-1]|uniref:Uncharacterized protein n=2 Tax=Magnetofaba TaxID=1472292 RepID=A0A1Y2K8Y3_9PROT|nr:hypothetical protein MAIT1_03862 [Magnetofaba australis IT-1]